MKKLLLKIDKNSIISDVSLASAYAAAKRNGGEGDFDKVAAMQSDSELLTRMWHEMCGLVSEKLKEFIEESAITDESMTLQLNLSNAYDETFNKSIESDLFGSISAGVTARWFRFSLPERAAEWERESLQLLSRGKAKLCHRTPPRRL